MSDTKEFLVTAGVDVQANGIGVSIFRHQIPLGETQELLNTQIAVAEQQLQKHGFVELLDPASSPAPAEVDPLQAVWAAFERFYGPATTSSSALQP